MIYNFGDVHFSSMNEWSHSIGDNFLSWFKARFNSEMKTNYAIFLGDIAEKDSNPGDVIDQMYKLFDFCNSHFKKTYILMGNHDIKLFRGHTVQTSLKFLNNFSNVEVIDSIRSLTIDGKNILCMPHIRTEDGNVARFYNNYDWSTSGLLDKTYQLAIGHWTIKDDSNFIYKDGVDTTRIPVDVTNSPSPNGVLCGHIHNRPLKSYIGSIWPANLEETKCNFPRCFIKWGDTWEEELLPDFVKYETIEYGAELEHLTDCVHLYTIDNAPSESDAKRKYNTFFIKGIKRVKKNKKLQDATTESVGLNSLNLSDTELFNAMLKEKKMVVSRKALKIMNELLKLPKDQTN